MFHIPTWKQFHGVFIVGKDKESHKSRHASVYIHQRGRYSEMEKPWSRPKMETIPVAKKPGSE